MTRRRLLAELSADELAHWQALYLLEGREQETAVKQQTLKTMTSQGVADMKRRLKHGRSGHRRN